MPTLSREYDQHFKSFNNIPFILPQSSEKGAYGTGGANTNGPNAGLTGLDGTSGQKSRSRGRAEKSSSRSRSRSKSVKSKMIGSRGSKDEEDGGDAEEEEDEDEDDDDEGENQGGCSIFISLYYMFNTVL